MPPPPDSSDNSPTSSDLTISNTYKESEGSTARSIAAQDPLQRIHNTVGLIQRVYSYISQSPNSPNQAILNPNADPTLHLFLDHHQKVLKLMLAHQVDFIIVGGYAVIFHGYARTTGNLDLWLIPDNLNRDKLIPVLRLLDVDENELIELASLDFTVPIHFHFWNEPERINFLTDLPGVKYMAARQHIIEVHAGTKTFPFLHRTHLIHSKNATARLKDKADVEELQKRSFETNPHTQFR